MVALLNLPSIQDQTAFNLDRWDDIGRDHDIAAFSGRCETNRTGQVLLSRYLPFEHGARMAEVALQMRHYLPHGKATVECPISASEGIKVADVVWISKARLNQVSGRSALRVSRRFVWRSCRSRTHARRSKRSVGSTLKPVPRKYGCASARGGCCSSSTPHPISRQKLRSCARICRCAYRRPVLKAVDEAFYRAGFSMSLTWER